MKSYIDCLDEISKDELFEGLLGHGMFAEKLPPVFSAEAFCNYCIANPGVFNKKTRGKYVYFESIRNICVPRPLGIPNPMKYAILCEMLRDNWDDIRNVFRVNTFGDIYKVSRLHIRKKTVDKCLLDLSYEDSEEADEDDQIPSTLENDNAEKALFCMNYKNWKIDGNPVLDFSLGKKYVVKTDITQCFPSIYTHAIAWALVGKQVAKDHMKDGTTWYNKIDNACQKMRDGETHGLMIGPHASNLLSEVILTSVDKELRKKGYDYIRNIDDYTCYTETHERAEDFITDLNTELRKYDLSVNHKKTVIDELPQFSSEYWIQQLKDRPIIGRYNKVDFNSARAYLDTAVSAMQTNGNNASAILYAVKVLGNNPITKNAKEYCAKTMCNLAIIYPYLVPIMDKYVFKNFDVPKETIESFTKVLYRDSVRKANFEGISYSLFYATKYDFTIPIDSSYIIQSTNCICKLLLLQYAKKKGDSATETALLAEAKRLISDIDENWVFVYETLSTTDLPDDWKRLKKAGISFLV